MRQRYLCFLLPLCREIRKTEMILSKKRYIQGFGIIVVVLGMVRCAFPEVASSRSPKVSVPAAADTLVAPLQPADTDTVRSLADIDTLPAAASRFFKTDGTPVKNRIMSVPHFGNTFPDQNDVQLASAQRWGVKPVADRADAEARKSELVYVGSNPYFFVDKLHNSVPYLVPRASALLQEIGRNFFDSLQIKGIPLHKIIVTSVLRSKADVAKLRGRNQNATENSCHLYGTTFDVCYNRYKTVQTAGQPRREVRNDSLKWVLSEVLRDMRQSNRCWIKYEVKQGCFHITVK